MVSRPRNLFLYLALACFLGLVAIFTFAFFLSMDIPQLFKITASIIVGIALIFVAAYIQRRRQQDKPVSEK